MWVDVSTCRYDALRDCVRKKGWGVLEASKEDEDLRATRDYNLYWTDKSLTRMRMKRLLPHQMANHFPDMHELCCKSFLASNLRSMRKHHPAEYDFFPETWILPNENKDFSRACKDGGRHNTDSSDLFIIKPERGCQGRGIFLTRSGDDEAIRKLTWEPGNILVAQRYVGNPFLIDGYKFDLRLYILVTSCDPLRIYIYRYVFTDALSRFLLSYTHTDKADFGVVPTHHPRFHVSRHHVCCRDGLARFCTEKFDSSGKELGGNWAYTHLTNYSLNRANKSKFCDSHDDSDATVGSKRRLSALLELLKKQGHDIDKLWAQIDEVAVKTIISAQPLLAHHHRMSQPDDVYGDRCFELLGMDVLLDENLKPWLLELNHSPSFHCDAVVDKSIKHPMLSELLDMLQPSLERRAKLQATVDPQRGHGTAEADGDKASEMTARMQQSVVAGSKALQADCSVQHQSLSEFDMDRCAAVLINQTHPHKHFKAHAFVMCI
jgi:tubulin polyglutamylase TTLL6/13